MRTQNSHSRTKTVIRAALVATLAVGLMAGSVFAARPAGGGGGKGKPGGGAGTGGGSLALVMVADANSNGTPNHGDTITFTVTTTATSPFVSVNCYQGSTWVYSASVGFFAAYPWSKTFILSATSWPSGAATCTARLYTSVDGSSSTTLSTMSFAAGA